METGAIRMSSPWKENYFTFVEKHIWTNAGVYAIFQIWLFLS